MSSTCSAIPFAAALAAALLFGRSSDRTGERRWHCAVPLFAGAAFFAMSAAIPGQPFAVIMIWLSLTAATTLAWPPPFWVLPTATLGTSAAAASIGLINACGNMGGFFGPIIVGTVLSFRYPMSLAIVLLSSFYIVAAVLILAVRIPRKERGAMLK
jgi:ACS family tartrate transporter-like MFS transporter